MAEDAAWHLDKKVPIAIIGALFLQTAAFIWIGATWKASLDFRIEALERASDGRKSLDERIIRLEERVIGIGTLVEKIDKRLQKTEDEQP